MWLKSAILAVAGVGLLAGSALANLINNGDFETGSLGADWKLAPFTGSSEAVVQNSPDVLTGYYASLNDSDSNGVAGIYQSFYIDPSVTALTVSFDFFFQTNDTVALDSPFFHDYAATAFALKGDIEDEFIGIGNWEVGVDIVGSNDSDWVNQVAHYTRTYIISSIHDITPNAVIAFGLAETSLYPGMDSKLGIDNVSITGTAPVPEPATMLLFGTGLAGLAGVVRRKKK